MIRIIAMMAVLCATCAAAHRAPAGWVYDPECCSSRDCQQVPADAVRRVAGGIEVIIRPGTHMMVPAGAPPVRAFVPWGDPRIRTSGDEHRHACVSRGGYVFCVYLPADGV